MGRGDWDDPKVAKAVAQYVPAGTRAVNWFVVLTAYLWVAAPERATTITVDAWLHAAGVAAAVAILLPNKYLAAREDGPSAHWVAVGAITLEKRCRAAEKRNTDTR